MPSYAPVSGTVVQTPAVLATLNEYKNKTLIPQGYVQTAFTGLLFGDAPGSDGTEMRPKVPIPAFRKPKRTTAQGTQVEMILNFETGSNVQTYRGAQDLNTGIYQGGTKIFSPWAQYTTFVTIARDQSLHNAGTGKQYDLLKSQLEQNTRQVFRRLETDLCSTNTDVVENSQDELPGIQHWIATTPTSTCHGLNRTTYTPFRNQTATIASFATGGLDGMQSFMYTTSGTNGNMPCDAIFTTQTLHGYYAKQAMAVHRITGSLNGADLGVGGTLFFQGIPLIHTPDWAAGIQTWINTADLHTFIETGSNWDMQSYQPPADLAVLHMQRWFFHAALLHARHETNGVITVSAA